MYLVVLVSASDFRLADSEVADFFVDFGVKADSEVRVFLAEAGVWAPEAGVLALEAGVLAPEAGVLDPVELLETETGVSGESGGNTILWPMLPVMLKEIGRGGQFSKHLVFF